MSPKPISRENGKLYEKHKKNMSKITHKIDNDAPLLPIESVTHTNKAKHDARRFKAITIENRMLMNRIVKMFRTHGTIDSHNALAGKKLSKLEKNQSERQKIDKENVKMFQRIVCTSPNYDTARYLNEWENKSLKNIRHSCRQIIALKELTPKNVKFIELPMSFRTKESNLVYLKVAIDKKPRGKLVFELFDDIAPLCVEYFLNLLNCNRKIDIQWIFPGTYLRFKHSQSTNFPKIDQITENIDHHSSQLAATIAPDKSLHFVVTFHDVPLPSNQYVTFGKVINGVQVLRHLEKLGHKHTGHPFTNVSFYEMGSIVRLEKKSDKCETR